MVRADATSMTIAGTKTTTAIIADGPSTIVGTLKGGVGATTTANDKQRA